jgi:hypothetical protein
VNRRQRSRGARYQRPAVQTGDHLEVAPRSCEAQGDVQAQTGWRTFLNHYRDQLLACHFFTVETVWLKTVYVLFFIELGTRRVFFAGCTTNPDGQWVTQQARQLTWKLEEAQTDT